MRWKFSLLLLATLLVLLPSRALAQEQSGSIHGTVRDTSGGVLPGVTVEARSPTVVGVNTAVTDAQGVYRFPALPPATYTLTANLQGFSPGMVEHVVLTLGQLLSVNITLSVGGLTETVQVTGESPLIDVKQNAAFATIQEELISRIPKGRDFTDILRNAPGAQDEGRAGGLQVDGASGSENRFIIDGMDTTNLQTGVSGKTMLIDFIQEVQVKSSGYNAEFGGATGGVVSAITKSGSNQIRGSAVLYEENLRFRGSLEKRPSRSYSPWRDTVTQQGLVSDETPWQYYSVVGDVGGPILPDRMWYYGGIAYTRNDYHTDVKFVNEPGHPERHFEWGSWAYYPNYNITTQLSGNMRLRVSGSNQRNRSRGSGPSLQSVNRIFDGSPAGNACGAWADMGGVTLKGYSTSTVDLTNCAFDQQKMDNRYKKTGNDSRNDVISGNLDWIITPKFFVNTTAGFFRTNSWTPEEWRGDDLRHSFSRSNTDSEMMKNGYPTVPVAFQQPSGFTDAISSSGTLRNIYTRLYVNANTTYFASLGGQHIFKAGMRFERFGNDVYSGYAKPNIYLNWGRSYNALDGRVVSGKYGYYYVSQTATVGDIHSNNYSFWVQDSWTIRNNLTINAGVRTENELVPSYATTPDATEIRFGFADKIAPRLGFA